MSSSINGDTYSSALFLDRTQSMLNQSIDRLSSGVKDLSSSGDASAVSESAKLSGQSARIQAANTNVQNATSYLQASGGFVSNINDVLSRMSELSALVKDPTKSTNDIADYQTEFVQLQTQLRDTVGGSTGTIGGNYDVTAPMGSFNGNSLFGSTAPSTVQIGEKPADKITLPSTNLQTGAMLALIHQDSSGNFTLNATDANTVSTVTAGLQQVSDTEGQIGAASASLSRAADNLTAQGQNVDSNVASIQDVDVAAESTKLAKYTMMTQASAAMLAQEQQDPKAILSVLASIHGK